jgi:aspartyl-tRNA synthetase
MAMTPFHDRTPCGNLRLDDVGREVHLLGWVDAFRDHGVILFAHLRDRSGLVQVVFSQDLATELGERPSSLREEFCVSVTGKVSARDQSTRNPALETGDIEVAVQRFAILNASKALPFPISEKAMIAGASREAEAVNEDLRLQYRYLDLRRPSMQKNFIKRHRILKLTRDFLDQAGFIEVETPVLTKSTPEGARDYLVPSRVHPGRFYALPQSPQLFKQLLMMSGFEKYFQIVKCYRDEDLRPNRQPEFTQLDLEASFIDEAFLYELIEELTVRMFAEGGISLPRPFPRLTHREAMEATGSDRPDLRFGLRFVDVTDVFRNTQYSIFAQILKRGGCIKGINVKGQSTGLSKNVLQNEYAKEIVPGFGGKGMTWMRVTDGKLDSNIVQFFAEAEKAELVQRFGAENGDVLMCIADTSRPVVVSVLGQLRLHVAHRLGLIPPGLFCPVWVTDFPLFEKTDTGVTSSHHPFTSPDRTDFDPSNRQELLTLLSRAYDLVVNGEELGGGSIRIHDPKVQQKIFRALGLSEAEVEEKFGFFIKALEYGAPPHGGIALGMDRTVAMILGESSIREVIAFPKNRSAYCPLTEAPSTVSAEQLQELGLLDLEADRPLPGADEGQDLISSLSWVSRIGIPPEEHGIIRSTVDEAVELAQTASELAGSSEPLYGIVHRANLMRPGTEAKISGLAESGELLKNAPAVKGDYFKVSNILE